MNQQDSRKWIGQPLDRVDGPAKVTGQATYAADYRSESPAAIGFIVEAGIGKGRIASIDTRAAEASDGVLLVLTHENAPDQAPFGAHEDAGRFGQSHAVLENDGVKYHGAPVAFVVAETLEQARHAAHLIDVDYHADEGVFDAEAHEDDAIKPDSLDGADEADSETGNFAEAFAKAPVKLEAEYRTPAQHASAMEPHATVAEWSDGKLTVHMAVQIISDARKGFANTLKIEPGDVRIVSPFIGGGFGSKLGIHNEAILAALSSRQLGRPVRVAQTRRNLFANGPHRTAHRHRLKLGADTDGRLQAISHDSLAVMSSGYPFAEAAGGLTQSSYAAEAIRMSHRIVEANVPKVDSMRAPGEAIGTLVFESAIDELAERCGIDPVEFRLLNEPEAEPGSGKPFSTRPLARCLREGAETFGWQSGAVRPGTKRDGRWLIGHGMAAAIRPNSIRTGGRRGVTCARREADAQPRHDGHRNRHIHYFRPDRGREPGYGIRHGRGQARRQRLRRDLRLGRLVRRRQHRHCRAGGLRKHPGRHTCARGPHRPRLVGCELRRPDDRGRPRLGRQSQPCPGRRSWTRSAARLFTPSRTSSLATPTRTWRNIPTALCSRRWLSMRIRPRSGCGVCLACSTPGASSTERRRIRS